MTLISSNFEMIFFDHNILELNCSELADTESCLEEELDDSIHPNIIFDDIAECTILERGEDSGRGDLILGMTDTTGWAAGEVAFGNKILEKRLETVEFATNAFESVLVIFEKLLELLEIVGDDGFDIGYTFVG